MSEPSPRLSETEPWKGITQATSDTGTHNKIGVYLSEETLKPEAMAKNLRNLLCNNSVSAKLSSTNKREIQVFSGH